MSTFSGVFTLQVPMRPASRISWTSFVFFRRLRSPVLTFAGVYDLPFFKNGHNWFLKNVAGNWLVAPIYRARWRPHNLVWIRI